MSFRAECHFGAECLFEVSTMSVILEWVSFRARCLLRLSASLGSSFSFNVYIIGQQNVGVL